MTRLDLTDGLVLVGLVGVVAGVALFSVAAAVILSGLALVLIGMLLGERS